MLEKERKYDLVIIGGGPAGYPAAIKAAKEGMKVACVEAKALGGTCLNLGCIPSKYLLDRTASYTKTLALLSSGILQSKNTQDLSFSMSNAVDECAAAIKKTTSGIEFLFKTNGVEKYQGIGKISGNGEVSVITKDNVIKINAEKIMIATGSKPSSLPGIEVDGKSIINSDHFFSLKEIPKNAVVIGGGAIGLELASIWRRIGSEIFLLEYAEEILPSMDNDLGKAAHSALSKIGISINTSCKASKVEKRGNQVAVVMESVPSGEAISELLVDKVLVATGRRPEVSSFLVNDGPKIELTKAGFVKISETFETSLKNVFAVGDAVEGPMLAHKAEEDAIAAIEFMLGEKPQLDHSLIPSVVYIKPEIASLGMTENIARDSGRVISCGKFPFAANGRAQICDSSTGFVKIIADKYSDKILGVHIIGPEAGSLISEACAFMTYGASAEDVARICHPHPEYSEALREAAMDVSKKAIHKG